MNSQIINIKGIGDVTFVKSKKAKRINISIKSNKIIRVAVPARSSIRQAKKFVISKTDWIHSVLKKTKPKENIFFDETTIFTTKKHRLQISKQKENSLNCSVKKGIIYVYYPENIPVTDTRVQSFIQKSIELALRIEATDYIPQRIIYLSKKYNLKFRQIKISKATTRWGSCSGRDNINISLQIMRLPEHLIDYVLLHELAHTIEKNHSPKFWNLLETISPNSKNLQKELKNFKY